MEAFPWGRGDEGRTKPKGGPENGLRGTAPLGQRRTDGEPDHNPGEPTAGRERQQLGLTRQESTHAPPSQVWPESTQAESIVERFNCSYPEVEPVKREVSCG